MWFILGEITYITVDFEPIVLDDAGLDDQIYLKDDSNSILEESFIKNSHGSS